MGRSKAKFQWEVKPHGTPFNGLGLGTSSVWMSTWGGGSYTYPVTGLTLGTNYHWRMRLKYQSGGWSRWYVFDRTSRWTGPDFRTAL